MSPALSGALKLAARIKQVTLPDLLRDTVESYLTGFLSTKSRFFSTKIEEAIALIDRIIALAKISKIPLQAAKGAEVGSAADRKQRTQQMIEEATKAFLDGYRGSQPRKRSRRKPSFECRHTLSSRA